jgi:hypothetical protein
MTCHAGIHQPSLHLHSHSSRSGSMTQALDAVRYRPHEVCVARFFVNDRAVETGLMGGGFVLCCRSLHTSLSTMLYAPDDRLSINLGITYR